MTMPWPMPSTGWRSRCSATHRCGIARTAPADYDFIRAAEGEPRHIEVAEDAAVAAGAGRKPYRVEVLGAGNQFVAIGHHPDGAFLDWADGRSPVTVSRDDLPAITKAQVADFLLVAGELLSPEKSRQNRQNFPVIGKADETDKPFVGFGGCVTADGGDALADVRAALAVIPGDDGCYQTWIDVGQAIHAATDGSHDGLAAWDGWSMKSPIYNPEKVQKKWHTFSPHSISFGTLVHMARKVDPMWRAPSWNQRDSSPDIRAQPLPPKIVVDILNRTAAPPPTLPLAVFGPDVGGWLQQVAVAANAPVDYVSTTLLAVAGSLIGNARWGKAWDGWGEPSVLWCALVGEPSASKTPAANAVLNLLRKVEADMAEDFEETYAAWEETACPFQGRAAAVGVVFGDKRQCTNATHHGSARADAPSDIDRKCDGREGRGDDAGTAKGFPCCERRTCGLAE